MFHTQTADVLIFEKFRDEKTPRVKEKEGIESRVLFVISMQWMKLSKFSLGSQFFNFIRS